MNSNDREYVIEKIRRQYAQQGTSQFDQLKALDKKAKRPANVFAYVFGVISAIVMGCGMSLIMTDIGQSVGVDNVMVTGVVIGAIGIIMAIINYPIFKGIMRRRRIKYADKIVHLSDKLMMY